ncbi:MAG: leucine-rich repeat protein [Lachnospiraceae bacterium]|nr:leucine-rich repeat protein [Lachnospiraceae bacterium]
MGKRIKSFSLLLFVLTMVMPLSTAVLQPQKVLAAKRQAVSAPELSVKSKTLYVGGSSYRVAFKNLAADARVIYLSSDKNVVTVTEKGLIRPVAKGKATVTAKITQGNENYTSEISITVKEPYVKITNPVEELAVGDTYCFEGKTYGLKKPSMSWSVSDPSLAALDEKTGILTALDAGKVRITFRDEVSGKSKSITLAITKTPDQDEEERAKKVVVEDGQTGYLMYQGLYYEILDKESVGIVDYYDLEISMLTIPDTIFYRGKAYRVTEIYEDVFSCCYDLKKLVVGNNVRVLGENAFNGCSALSEVVLGDGLREIRGHVFEGCESLEKISIPEGVTTLGEEVFCGCTALSHITLPETLTLLGDSMFFDCNSLVQVRIPAAVETIPYGLFTNCDALSQVELGEGVLVIEPEAFWACESLKEITLPKGLVFIGDHAFYNCALNVISFPDRKVSIGENIFDFCDELALIRVTKGTADYYEAALGDWYDYEVVE